MIAARSLPAYENVCTDTSVCALSPMMLCFSARIGHAGAVIGSKWYVSGGRTGLQAGDDTLADLWRWSIPEASWQLVEPKGAAPPPLSYHVLATSGHFLYAFGGCTIDHGRTNGLWCLDTTNDEWTELASPNTNADSSAGPCGRGGPCVAASETEVWVGFGQYDCARGGSQQCWCAAHTIF